MTDTNIRQNLDQEPGNLDIPTSSDQQQTNTSQQTREWGPGTPKYYMDTMGSYMGHHRLPKEDSEQKVASEVTGSKKQSGLREFAQKVMKALNLTKHEKFVDAMIDKVEGKSKKEDDSVKKQNNFAKSTDNKTDKIKKKNEESDDLVQKDHLARSLGNQISDIKKEAESEYEKTKDPMTRTIVDLTDQLEKELQKETLDWNKVDLLVRQIAILLVQKMANNDGKAVQEEIKMIQQDVEKIRDTYNTKWELFLGVSCGFLAIVGGATGLTGGIGGVTGAISPELANSISTFGKGFEGVSSGVQPFKEIAGKSAQSDQQLYMYEKERDQSHKQTVESSLQGNKSMKGSQLSQRERAIEAAYRAFVGLAQ